MDQDQPGRVRPLALALDVLERSTLAVFFGYFAVKMLLAFQATGSVANLILFLSEGLVILFILIRRTTAAVSLRPGDWLIAVVGTAAPLLVAPGGEALAPSVLCAALMLAGFGLQTAAKLTLRRSFGVVAANRGVKIGGPYRAVRHPMYAGYVLTHVGFLLANPTAWNLGVYLVTFAFQVARLLAEERLLGEDAAYREFAALVPYRLVPRVF